MMGTSNLSILSPRRALTLNIPLKLNAAGVMPIIFAQAIMFVPLYLILGNYQGK